MGPIPSATLDKAYSIPTNIKGFFFFVVNSQGIDIIGV
jgi:hypothetical protein